MRPSLLLCALFVMCATTSPAKAVGATPPDSIVLTTGDTLTGSVVAQTDNAVTLIHPTLGKLTISRGDIAQWTHQSTSPDAAQLAALLVKVASDESVSTDALAPDKLPDVARIWSGHVDLGATGASGNSDTSSANAAFGLKRKTDLTTLTLEANYRLATDNGATTTNRFFDVIRFDRALSKKSKWSFFAQTSQEIDEFKDYNFRLAGSGGAARQFIHSEKTQLMGHLGLGAAREFGGSDTGVSPFALFGSTLTRKINSRMSFNAGGEFEPRFDKVGEYRLRGNASLTVNLDSTGKLKLKLGLEDEFDSDPGTAANNDFYYTASIVYSF